MPIGRSFFTFRLSFLFSGLVSADWLWAGAPCTADQRADPVDRCEADEAVDDAGDRVRLSELEAEDPGHEIELRDCDETSVEAADDQERGGEQIELSHCCTPPV
jgi:hypothetical protein